MSKWCRFCEVVQVEKFNFCPECGGELEIVEKVKTTFFVHSDGDGNYNNGKEMGLSGKALDNFCRTGFEISFEIEVNLKTGEAKAISMNNVDLPEPIEI
jgi:hypothetical protein